MSSMLVSLHVIEIRDYQHNTIAIRLGRKWIRVLACPLPIESETSRRKFSLYKKESLYLFEMSKFITPYIPHSESSIPYSGVWVARFFFINVRNRTACVTPSGHSLTGRPTARHKRLFSRILVLKMDIFTITEMHFLD